MQFIVSYNVGDVQRNRKGFNKRSISAVPQARIIRLSTERFQFVIYKS